jgi:hypothetical protein
VPSTRLQRSAATLDELRAAVRDEFGPGARIIAAEKVTSGGLGGLFRKAHYEATVEVPDPTDSPTVRVAIAADRTARAGILALLEDAEEAEDRLAGTRRGRRAAEPAPAPAPEAETATVDELTERSDAFASIMDDFTFNGLAPAGTLADALAGGPAEPAPGLRSEPTPSEQRAAFEALASAPVGPVAALSGGTARGVDDGALPMPPAVRSTDGDLVRAPDAAAVAAALATTHGLRLVEVDDRRSGILARATGVQDGCGSVTAVAWPHGVTAGSLDAAARLEGIGPDQVWVVVDAGRKHEDTARDVRSVAAAVPIAGLVVVGAGETSSPETVHMLGLPVLDARTLGV